MTNLFPMFLKLEGRPVPGGGRGQSRSGPKIGGLLDTGARIRVVALEATPAVREWAQSGKIESRLCEPFLADDLDGVFLAVVATASRVLNERIYREAQRRGVLCNVVDVPDLCDFFYPSVVRRGDLQIAVSTAGQSPSLAQKIRQQLEKQFGPGYAAWVEELGETRQLILASDLDQGTQARLAAFTRQQRSPRSGSGRESTTSTFAGRRTRTGRQRKRRMRGRGKVYLVGAGPGDPELLTLKALRAAANRRCRFARRSGRAGNSESDSANGTGSQRRQTLRQKENPAERNQLSDDRSCRLRDCAWFA